MRSFEFRADDSEVAGIEITNQLRSVDIIPENFRLLWIHSVHCRVDNSLLSAPTLSQMYPAHTLLNDSQKSVLLLFCHQRLVLQVVSSL